MKVVITGSEGFIGRYVSSYIANQKVEVVRVDLQISQGVLSPWSFLYKLQTDENFASSITHIFHIGANSNAQSVNLKSIIKENTFYTNSLANTACGLNIPFIFVSTAATYGTDHNLELSPYAKSKILSENYINDLMRINDEWEFQILRLFNVYGPGEKDKGKMISIPSNFIKSALLTGNIEIYDLALFDFHYVQSRDFIFVDDLAKYFFNIDKYINLCHVLDIGSGDSVPFDQIAKKVQELISCKVSRVTPPNEFDFKFYQTRTCAQNHFRQIVDFELTSLESGINQTYHYWKEVLNV